MRIYKSFFRFEKCRKACKYRLYRLMRTYKEIVKNYILIYNEIWISKVISRDLVSSASAEGHVLKLFLCAFFSAVRSGVLDSGITVSPDPG